MDRQSRKRKSDEVAGGGGGGGGGVVVEEDMEQRRRKRKRGPHSSHKKKMEQEAVKSQETDMTDQAQAQVGSSPENENSNENSSSLKLDKSRAAEDTVEPSPPEMTVVKKSKKSKSKKDKVADSVSTVLPEDVDIKSVSGKKEKEKEKKKKKKDKYPDPSLDTTLSESALKALAYVHERLSSHSAWKFNKARQNWLLRNIWDTNAIPELYFPSCVKYLKGVQGNSRQILMKECNSILEEEEKDRSQKPVTEEESAKGKEGTVRFKEPEPEPARGEKVDSEVKTHKLLRAKTILAKLGDQKD